MSSRSSKKMQEGVPSTPTGIANVNGREHLRRPSEKEGQKNGLTKKAPPQTTQKTKMKQPAIRRAMRRADTLAAMKSAPKRKRSGIAPDSCGKPGEPHNLEGGALASRDSFISKKRRRKLDAGWDQGLAEAGSSEEHAHMMG